MLECVYESRGVLNLSLFESRDERRVHFETGDDGTSIAISFPLEERRGTCQRTYTQQRTKCNTARHKHQLDQIQVSKKKKKTK